MKPIDTLYKSNFFRSRLEARWAVFFDAIGEVYEYEPQGFKHNGEWYLPDFYLPNCHLRNRGEHSKGLYIEIKPESFLASNYYPSKWFTDNLVMFRGTPEKNIWDTRQYNKYDYETGGFELARRNEERVWDNCMLFWKCVKCGTCKIDFSESNYDECPLCGGKCHHDLLIEASEKATKKRFEYESPNITP